MIIHIVQSGETLSMIARRYGTTQESLIIDNGLAYPERLCVGQCIAVQTPTLVHTVKDGETLLGIADEYSVGIDSIFRYNPGLFGRDLIRPGEKIIIKCENEKIARFEIGGYAYPFISDALLDTTLPYMTYLMPFTYGIKNDGTLIAPDDERLLSSDRIYSVKPFMHLSSLSENGTFSNELSNLVLNNNDIRSVLIESVIENIELKGYFGVDVDFEFLLPEDKEAYVDFIGELREKASEKGYEVFVALPPKTSADMSGLLYEGSDYYGLGASASAVLLMTYEWGYTYGPPMAVSPVNAIRRVLNYAVSEIPNGKIFMGLSNYGYDWTLPYVKGESRATSISNVEAVSIASKNGAEILYDEVAEAPYFFYENDGKTHEVHFEDARSMLAKFSLIAEYGFRGGLFWNLDRKSPQTLITLNSFVDIKR